MKKIITHGLVVETIKSMGFDISNIVVTIYIISPIFPFMMLKCTNLRSGCMHTPTSWITELNTAMREKVDCEAHISCTIQGKPHG